MEHHGWEWSGDEGGGDADTADLNNEHDLGFADLPHELGGHEFAEHDFGGTGDAPDLGGQLSHDLGGDGGDLSGHDLGGGHDHGLSPGDGLDEPLGTEHATAHFDESLAHHADLAGDDGHGDHDAGDAHDGDRHDDPGADGDHGPDAGHGSGGDGPDGPDGPDNHHPDGFDDGEPDDHRPEALVGTDPDLHHGADDPGWHEHAFPPELGMTDPPEPVDGFPWSDPATLGGDGAHDDYTHLVDRDAATPPVSELAQYAGVDVPAGTDAWSALLGSDDPATSTLARWWVPGT